MFEDHVLPFELFESPEGEFGSELGEGVLLSGQSPPMPSPFFSLSFPENRFMFRFQSCFSAVQDYYMPNNFRWYKITESTKINFKFQIESGLIIQFLTHTLGVPELISTMAYLYAHRGPRVVKKSTKIFYK